MTRPLLCPAEDLPPAGLGARLAAMAYDGLLCIALLVVTAGLYTLARMAILGEARLRALSEAGALDGDPWLRLVLLGVLFGFFALFWMRGGQTLGMQVWRVRVQDEGGGALSLRQAAVRFVVAAVSWGCLGLGVAWALRDGQRRCWHDLCSGSRLVRLPKRQG
ncbi:RDD family protein [Pseudomonas monteilii]|uniref:RDD family protein n=1 Tax=Pseudomonas alabamensis TaxID=3064349 RepID=UPI0027130E58|nr:RDD family protein [Pseudomonas sp. 22-AL-CL-001]MDO7910971.1 RDD family protein [Pseudomonas sp. 22-AL-CL-001]